MMETETCVCLGIASHPEAEAVLGWSDQFVGELRARLSAVRTRATLEAHELADLRHHGLIRPTTDDPTTLGAMLIDLLVREEWQDGDEFASLLQEAATELAGASVLEVGCSTGRRLRTLEGPGMRLGVDHDALAVALGWRLARNEGQPVEFHCCSATALPFADATFDLVVCRNALTYMHQRTALREMTRVLRPDGVLFLRVENFR